MIKAMTTCEPERRAITIEGATNEIVILAGIGRNQVWNATRMLRGADEDLWPTGARGRAKPNYPKARHLVNLAIALAATQADSLEVAVGRVRAFRMLVQLDDSPYSKRTFGDAFDELLDHAARDTGFCGRVLMHKHQVIQLEPTQRPHALITIGSDTRRYAAPFGHGLHVAQRMNPRRFGIASIAFIDGSFIKTLGVLLRDFRAAQTALASESDTSLPGEVPPFTRPTDDSVAATPHMEDRSPNSSDSNPCVCVCAAAIARPEGGSHPPGAHDARRTDRT